TGALEIAQNNLAFASGMKMQRIHCMVMGYLTLALVSTEMGEAEFSKNYRKEAARLELQAELHNGDTWGLLTNVINQLQKNQFDSAITDVLEARDSAQRSLHYLHYGCLATAFVADIYTRNRDFVNARKYYQMALQECDDYDNIYIQARVYRDLANLFNRSGR